MMSSQNNGITSYPSGITSYLTMHTHLHANQLNKELWVCHELRDLTSRVKLNSHSGPTTPLCC